MNKRLNRKEAASYLGISLVTLDRLLAKNAIRHFRIGRRVLFAYPHLDTFLADCEHGQNPPMKTQANSGRAVNND